MVERIPLPAGFKPDPQLSRLALNPLSYQGLWMVWVSRIPLQYLSQLIQMKELVNNYETVSVQRQKEITKLALIEQMTFRLWIQGFSPWTSIVDPNVNVNVYMYTSSLNIANIYKGEQF